MPFQLSPEICPICQRKSKFKYIQDWQSKDGQFSLYECFCCQAQFWQPFKSPGRNWYENYDDKGNKERISFSKETFASFQETAYGRAWYTEHLFKNFLFQKPKGKKLLDVGCGTGGFLSEAKKLGYEVYGVDFDENEASFIRENLDIKNVFAEDVFEFLKNKQGFFDVITGFEILEHLDKPKEFLELLYQALKPEGYLILSMPNRERFFGKITEWWDFPLEHLSRWNIKSLENIVNMAGFKVIKIKENELFEYFIEKLNRLGDLFLKTREAKIRYKKEEANIASRIWFQKNTIIDIFLNLPRLNKFRGLGLIIFAQKIKK